jgi:hypothetical protein
MNLSSAGGGDRHWLFSERSCQAECGNVARVRRFTQQVKNSEQTVAACLMASVVTADDFQQLHHGYLVFIP